MYILNVKMEEVKLSAGGRIVIPKKMRKVLRVEEGDGLLLSMEGKKLVIQSMNMVENPVEKLYGSVKVGGKNPKKEAREWMRKRVEEDL